MTPAVVYEDEHASIVYGHNLVTLGHLKIYPKVKVSSLDLLPAKTIAHLFALATRCGSLLFDGLQAQGTNIILNEGKNANQQDDNICIDVIARFDKDELSFTWKPKQGDMNQIKQTASDVAGKVIVYEKPAEPSAANPPTLKGESSPPKKESEPPVTIKVAPSPEEFGMKPVTTVERMPRDEPISGDAVILEQDKKDKARDEKPMPKPKDPEDIAFDKKTNFLLYELMRMP